MRRIGLSDRASSGVGCLDPYETATPSSDSFEQRPLLIPSFLSMASQKDASLTASSYQTAAGQKHVVIIGAGAGGTCLAARLGKLGHRVTVVERVRSKFDEGGVKAHHD